MSIGITERQYIWASNPDTDLDYNLIFAKIDYHADKRFGDYEPTRAPYSDFKVRLKQWLDLAETDDDQKLMLRLANEIFFVGRDDYASLYRSAFNGPIRRWIVERTGMLLDDDALSETVNEVLGRTWFCPITDSMQIASFCHINRIKGVDYRPDWRSLPRFGGTPESVAAYMQQKGLDGIVLLEDFVGSGTQMTSAAKFASKIPASIHVLIVPLIVCPKGLEVGREIAQTHSNIQFMPVLEIPESCFVGPEPQLGEERLITELRQLAKNCYENVISGVTPKDDKKPPYGPFGWDKTGAMIVMYTNCPNNTLPMIHWESNQWCPLFPRAVRV